MKNKGSEFLKFAVALAAVALAGKASAAVTFTSSGTDSGNGAALSASVTFSTDASGDLVVTLVNTSAATTIMNNDVLTAVFFSGAGTLTTTSPNVSATAGAGSTEWNFGKNVTTGAPEGASSLGQQWEYLGGLSGAPHSATAGISSTGLNIFGSGNFASGGVMLDGVPYGLLPAGFNNGNSNKSPNGFSGGSYIQDSMTFVLGGFNGNLSSITDVVFQYGSSTSEPELTGNLVITVPEANYGMGAACAMLPMIGFAGLKRFRKVRA